MFGLFKKKEKPKQELCIKELVVNNLEWRLKDGFISYDFKVKLKPANEKFILALNKELKVRKLESNYKIKRWFTGTLTERDLGWAQVNAVRILFDKEAVGREVEIKGRVEGSPEDFTLSKLGVRFGRVVLKDELIWHPVIGLNLVSWGMVGRVCRYEVNIPVRSEVVVGPGERVVDGNKIMLKGEPDRREPGVSIIAGSFKRIDKSGFEIYTLTGGDVEAEDAVRAIEFSNHIWGVAHDNLGVKEHSYERIAVIWDDIDPFMNHNLVCLRAASVKALGRKSVNSLYEIAYAVSSHILSESHLGEIADYWMYEALQHATALSILYKDGYRDAVREVIKSLVKCIDTNVKRIDKLPTLSNVIGVPRDIKGKVVMYCKAPLVFWSIAHDYGVETLFSLIKCLVKAGRGYSIYTLEDCLRECIGDKAEEFEKNYIRGKEIPFVTTHVPG